MAGTVASTGHPQLPPLRIVPLLPTPLLSSPLLTISPVLTLSRFISPILDPYSPSSSWEYPGRQGIGCNTISPQDSANFLSFLQEMRQLAPNLTLSAAASDLPWVGADGNPMTDLSEFAKVLNWTGECLT